ncbi:hypothetical protein PV683_02515 [Streptomyces sp. AK08-01B]|nr:MULTISPECIES: hypothetical protein [unclassified Streptomyces]MDX3764632.1 hypothetical protein [Streptomyces sp. AK08-01B]MDX3813685.1 hypothetical protein [Streptomyces sp. AK08-01A]
MPSVERERVDADDRAFEVLLRDGRVEAVDGEVAPGPRGLVGIRGRVDVQAGDAVDRLENDAAADRPLELGRLLGAVHHLVTDRAEVVLGEQLAGEALSLRALAVASVTPVSPSASTTYPVDSAAGSVVVSTRSIGRSSCSGRSTSRIAGPSAIGACTMRSQCRATAGS